MTSEITITNKHLNFSRVTLKEPLNSGFILIAAEVDKKTSFWGESRAKKSLIKNIKSLFTRFKGLKSVLDIVI